MNEKYYITTAIAYTSGKPHIGNTYEIVLADSIARYKRMLEMCVRDSSPDRKKPERRAQHGEQNSEKKQKNRQRPEKKRPVDNPNAQQKETKNQEKSRSAHRRRRRRPSKEAGKPTGENQ